MKKIYQLLAISLCLFPFTMKAQQDIHFSQFYSSPTFINPGATGIFNGNIRATINYRNQWKTISDPFTTISAGFDSRLFHDKMKNGFVGAGLVFYNDKAGVSKLTTGRKNPTKCFFL